MPLTDREVRHAEPAEKVKWLADGDGLYLKITPAGARVWYFRSQRAGAPPWTKLGEYPRVSLLEARNKAHSKASQLSTRTVASVYPEYVSVLERQYDEPQQVKDRFARDILPALGDRRLDSVTRTDCSDLLKRIVDRGSLVAANRTLPDIKRFFAWCVERGWLDTNPAALITRRSVGGRERSRNRALSFEELAVVIGQLKPTRTGLGLACILITGQRPEEVQRIDRAELVSRSWWHIPAERTKPRRLQKVYLSPQARAVLTQAFRLYGPRPFASLNRCALARAASRIRGVPKFTPHDFRRTMSTRLADLGVAPHVTEKMLNHKLEGVLAVYNVAEYLPERRAAWRLWGVKLAALRRLLREAGDLPERTFALRKLHTSPVQLPG